MGVLRGIQERRRPAASAPPRGVSGGFPEVRSSIRRRQCEETISAPPPAPPRAPPLEGQQLPLSDAGSEAAAISEENAARLAGMSVSEIEEAVREVRAAVGEEMFEWLRGRKKKKEGFEAAPRTRAELEAATESLPKSEKKKLEHWKKEGSGVKQLVACARAQSTKSAKRVAISQLKESSDPEAAAGLAAGLFVCLDDGDVDRECESDRYAAENLRDSIHGLRGLKNLSLDDDEWSALGSIAVSRARVVHDAMRTDAIGIALEALCAGNEAAARGVVFYVDTPKAAELLRLERSDVDELFALACEISGRAPPEAFLLDLNHHDPKWVARIAAVGGYVDLAARLPSPANATALCSGSSSSDEVRRARLCAAAAEETNPALKLRLWAALARDSNLACPSPSSLFDRAEDDPDATLAALEYLEETGLAAPRAVRRAVARCGFSHWRVHEAAARVFDDPSHYLFALAAVDKGHASGPRIAALACATAAKFGFVKPDHLDAVNRDDLPPPPCWLLAPIIDGDVRCLRALERGNRYADALPPGSVFAHVAHAALFDLDYDADDLARRSSSRDFEDALKDIDADDPVAKFAEAIVRHVLDHGDGSFAAKIAAHLLRPNFPLAARRQVWRDVGRVGLLRVLPVTEEILLAWRDQPPSGVEDDVALALANDPYDPVFDVHRLALHHLATFLNDAGDFHRRTKLEFLRKNAKNPHTIERDLLLGLL
ncbi:hypothetical protein CTAYLR_009274 [Chrysophaeum taylorii]|uniref:RPAP1 N-terminal domain-containing protein n=1 Tax=Chrysophaeum taylorii TaxID=2483200 RepID=A0AAD7XNY7_9STRA|nr:hypothetical protein CTAYLR_009274 [Chrysophaeum taylorii]